MPAHILSPSPHGPFLIFGLDLLLLGAPAFLALRIEPVFCSAVNTVLVFRFFSFAFRAGFHSE
jgi:hypothetical protein